ncbi:EAL domain-containing protein [Butyrivibrio proteoclasticus]|uniref:EAL domain-containing protein n=1 Tax=Butyrivibrio proteoclasticus TaxID=43305 RepID=UPI00047A5CA1|nr:EAL domain-containing protein [Butyrivibrio proteoclasticus]
MVLYLTSSFIPYQECGSYEKKDPGDCYGFFEDLRTEWPESPKMLYVPCDPTATTENDQQKRTVVDTLEMKNLKVSEVRVLTEDDKDSLSDLLSWANVIYLAGGHAPTQLAFMKRIGLKQALLTYDGIIISLSAGSMNAAYNVYLAPELPGEASDPNYVRFSDGLDLTNIEMIPHAECLKKAKVDGMDFIEDIVLPDSFGSRFYLVSDGSYFKVKNGKTVFKGVGEKIEDGMITPLKQGTIIPFMGVYEQPVIKALMEDGYELVVSVNITNSVCEVYHLSDELSAIFEGSRLQFNDICFKLSQNVVDEERDIFLDNIRIPYILEELKEKGNYVRTLHVDTPEGQKAKNIRVREVPGYPDWLLFVFFDITTALDHDWLTDEYARTGFMKRAKLFIQELSDDEHYSLVYTNVKGFKAVNELFGDQSGDMVIFQTRDVLRQYLKPVIMGRLESDHFVLITSDENLKDKTLKTMCNQVFKIESKEFNYEIRCGIYAIKNSSAEITQLLGGAKMAEKNIEAGSGNHLYAYYDDVMKEDYVKQRFLLSDLERGLSDNEFEPYYQPIVDAKTGEIASAEMLIRWRHKDFGMVAPGEFIPIIEAEGKISSLDNYIVSRGMELIARRMHKKQRIVPCAINLSRVDFYDSVFIESILERIKDLELDPTMIRFEVTESACAELETKAMDYLNEMRVQGIRILLDDYGSGMSSLSMLENFNFDIIKLDMGFVRKIGLNDKVESIIITTIGLAHMIGAKVTAEGVETEEQLKFLRDYDCDYIQGYYFYKPMPEAEFEKLLG